MANVEQSGGELANNGAWTIPVPVENRVKVLQSASALTLQFDLSDFGAENGLRIETYPDTEQRGSTRLLIDIKERRNTDGKPSVHTFAHDVRLPLNANPRGITATFDSRTKHLLVVVPTFIASN